MKPSSSSPYIRLSQVGMRFEQKEVLHDVQLTLEAGSFLVLAGSNGGGKTTLLRILAGLLQPTTGVVERQKGLRLGYLPQYRQIDRQFPLTTREVVLSGLHNRKRFWQPFRQEDYDRVEQLLNDFHLTDLTHRPIDALSGGQWQRVLLARAFASNPQVLLMDEPDTHLDADNRAFLYDRLALLPPDTATVIVSHDPSFLAQHPTLYIG